MSGPRTPEILPSEIAASETLGVGSFGKVLKGKCRGKDVAIKMLHKPILDEEQLASFKKEVAIMRCSLFSSPSPRSTIFHPNICLFMGASTVPGNFFIVQEYLPGGDVEKLLRNNKVTLSLYRRMQMAKDAALGMNWLHCSRPIFIHRDLKTSNLLLDESGRVKVCDFGLSQVKESDAMLKDEDMAKGTPLWMAPEVMQFKEFNEKADVYSFGIVLWELLTRKEPFAHHTNYSKFRRAVCEGGERPEIPEGTEPSLRYLITRCWKADPNERPSFKQIVAQLEHILVDVAVADRLGRKFWKDEFLGREEVPWMDFQAKFSQLLNLPDDGATAAALAAAVNVACLKALLAQRPSARAEGPVAEVVAEERFGHVLEWFGPITEPADPDSSAPPLPTILDEIRTTLAHAWFHGDVDERQSLERLSGKPGGTFLVRFSSVPGWFTVSQITDKRVIQHRRIRHKPGHGYMLDEDRHPSLEALVQALGLTLACDGSRFRHLFEANKPQVQGYISADY